MIINVRNSNSKYSGSCNSIGYENDNKNIVIVFVIMILNVFWVGFSGYVAPATTVVSLALTSIPMRTTDIWVTLAVCSVLLAAMTVAAVMIIIMKSRKLHLPDRM